MPRHCQGACGLAVVGCDGGGCGSGGCVVALSRWRGCNARTAASSGRGRRGGRAEASVGVSRRCRGSVE